MAKRKMPAINERQYVVSLEIAMDVLKTGWAERENGNTGKWLVAEDDCHRPATRTETKFLNAAEARPKLEVSNGNTNAKKVLVTKCHIHPRYMAEHKPKTKCGSCWLLYVFRWQFSGKTDEKVGAFNPFAYLIGDVDLEDACSGIETKPVSAQV